jgi:hypothetical protein
MLTGSGVMVIGKKYNAEKGTGKYSLTSNGCKELRKEVKKQSSLSVPKENAD